MCIVPASTSLEVLSDEQLVSLARDNHEEAFVHVVSRLLPMLQKLSLKYCSSLTEAEDLVQEGRLALLSAVRTFRGEDGVSFRTYAYACVRNRMISVLRRHEGHVEIDFGLDEPLEAVEETVTDPADLFLRREALVGLHSRIRELLTPMEYQVLMLYLASYSYREIAERLNLDAKAVDNALQRMRRKVANSSILS